MKKSISVLILVVMVAAGAFALDFNAVQLSAGGGLLFDFSGNNGINVIHPDIGPVFNRTYEGYRNMSFGAFGFFDAAYVELSFNMAYGLLQNVLKSEGHTNASRAGRIGQLGFSLLGKYPIDMSTHTSLPLTIFPMLGVDFNIVFASSADFSADLFETGSFRVRELTQFSVLAGVGGDYDFNCRHFFRASVLLQMRFANKLLRYNADARGISDGYANTTLGIGPRVQVGVGRKF